MNLTSKAILKQSDESEYGDYFDASFPGWLSVLILIVGLIGNLLCLVVLCKKKMRKNSAFVYLGVLSLVDIFVLLFGLGDIILIAYFRFMIRNTNLYICRLHSFITYVFTHFSSLLLALVSLDRAIATNLITFAKLYCRPESAIKIMLVTFLITMIINSHYLIFLGHEKTESNNTFSFECASSKNSTYEHFMELFEWVDLVVYSILPFIIMTFCSFLIIRVLFNSAKRLNRSKVNNNNNNYDTNKKSKSEATITQKDKTTNLSENIPILNNTITTITTTTTTTTTAILKLPEIKNIKKNVSNKHKHKHLSYTLITLNFIFFVLISPLVIVLVIIKNNKLSDASKILVNTVYLLAYSNHSLNFFLYGFSSPPFREEVLHLMTFIKKSNQMAFNNDTIINKDINNMEMTSTNIATSKSQYSNFKKKNYE